jgi:hypothetical protein
MKTKHDIWLTALQGHEKAPLNDQELKQALEMVSRAVDSLEALSSIHYTFVIQDLSNLQSRLYQYPNIAQAMKLLQEQNKTVESQPEIPGCRCCGQTKYNCVACGWELGSG